MAVAVAALVMAVPPRHYHRQDSLAVAAAEVTQTLSRKVQLVRAGSKAAMANFTTRLGHSKVVVVAQVPVAMAVIQ